MNENTNPAPVMDRVKAYAEKVKADGYGKHMFEGPDDFCQFIGEKLDRFPAYVQAVARYDNAVSLAYATMEGEELRDKVASVDRSRRLAHDSAIDAVNILNRAFSRAGVEPFSDVDTSNRTAVADFAGRFTIEAFDRQIYGGDHAMDRAVKNLAAGSQYSPKMQQLMRQAMSGSQAAPGQEEGPDR